MHSHVEHGNESCWYRFPPSRNRIRNKFCSRCHDLHGNAYVGCRVLEMKVERECYASIVHVRGEYHLP